MKRFYLRGIWVVLALLAAIPASVIAEEPADTTAIIGGWNFFGNPTPVSNDRAANIAQGIAWLDPEVLGVCEVRPHSIIDKVVEELGKLGAKYKHFTPPQDSNLKIGLLFKEGVKVENVKLIDNSNLGNPSHRKALSAKVTVGKFDFVMVVVHLKSSRGKPDRETRTKQCKVLAKFIKDATAGPEKDIIVVGDYNMIPPKGRAKKDKENFEAMSPAANPLYYVSSVEIEGGTHIHKGGALGNLTDRVVYGEVIDWLDFHVASYTWPTFNVADSCIVVGVCVLILEVFLNPEEDKEDELVSDREQSSV